MLFYSQIRAKLKGKFLKDGYLEIPVVIACSADESVVQAQKSAQLGLPSQHPKRRKGTFFCITGNSSLMRQLNDSNLEFYDEEEGDKNIVGPKSWPLRNLQGNFKDIVNSCSLTNETNSNREFTREESDTRYFLNNGKFKLISVV